MKKPNFGKGEVRNQWSKTKKVIRNFGEQRPFYWRMFRKNFLLDFIKHFVYETRGMDAQSYTVINQKNLRTNRYHQSQIIKNNTFNGHSIPSKQTKQSSLDTKLPSKHHRLLKTKNTTSRQPLAMENSMNVYSKVIQNDSYYKRSCRPTTSAS